MLKKLYVVELNNGEKKYYATKCDMAYEYNMMSEYNKLTCKLYEVELVD